MNQLILSFWGFYLGVALVLTCIGLVFTIKKLLHCTWLSCKASFLAIIMIVQSIWKFFKPWLLLLQSLLTVPLVAVLWLPLAIYYILTKGE